MISEEKGEGELDHGPSSWVHAQPARLGFGLAWRLGREAERVPGPGVHSLSITPWLLATFEYIFQLMRHGIRANVQGRILILAINILSNFPF